jgi:site-specific recombinase XerD
MNPRQLNIAVDEWLFAKESEGLSLATIKTYREHLNIVRKGLRGDELKLFTVRRFLAEYRRDHSPYSCRSIAATLKSLLRFHQEEWGRQFKLPRVPESPRRGLSHGQLKALFAMLAGDRSVLGLRNQAVVAIMVDCGLRRGEAIGLKVEDLADGALRVLRTKTGRARVVPYGRRVGVYLAAYLSTSRPRLRPKCENVFVSDEGYPWSANGLHCMVKRLSQRLGFHFSCHLLRHTFTTQALLAGADLETLRRIGGWTDYKMLKVYAHMTGEDLKRKHAEFSPLDKLG